MPANSKQLAGFSGGFYVITEQDDAGYSSVIRYTGSGCNVQPDSSFDAGPVLWDWGGGTQNIAADSAGELFVTATYTTDIFGPTGELQGQVPVWAQNLNISGDGTMFTEAFVGTPQRFLRVDDGGFVQDPAFAPQGFTFVGGTLSLSADRVVIGSSPSFQAPWQLFFLDGSGADAGAFGNTATPFASDGFCWISQILDCGGGNLCVVDTNCAQVSVWSSSGVELAYGSPPGGQLRSAAVDGSGSLWVLVSDLSTGGVILERATGVP